MYKEEWKEIKWKSFRLYTYLIYFFHSWILCMKGWDGNYLLEKLGLIYLPLEVTMGPEYIHSVKVVTFFLLQKKTIAF